MHYTRNTILHRVALCKLMHNVKETSLNIVCIAVLALTSVVAVSVFDNDNLDCGVSMCLGVIVIAIGMLLSIFPKFLFSDCSECLGIKLSNIADKFVSTASVQSKLNQQ